MNGRNGTAVVMNVRDPKIIAAYRPEVAARRLARPGSAIKPFVLLRLLETGKLKKDEAHICKGDLRIGGRNLACSHPRTAQPLTPDVALAYSCNEFFATYALRLSTEEMRWAFMKFGLTSPTGLREGEASGQVLPVSTRERKQLQAIGEYGIKVTPLEMLAAYRAMGYERPAVNLSVASKTMYAGLEASTDYGMSRLAQPQGLRVAGKTGTSKADEGAWTHAWFVGYAPADRPEIAVVVYLERGTGPGDAAPLAAQIFKAWMANR